MTTSIRAVLEAAFPGRDVRDVTEMAGSEHPGNQTVRVQFVDADHCFLKVRVDGDSDRNQREVATLRYAHSHCDVRVPSVVAADSEFRPPYLATEPLDGTPLIEDWQAESHRESVARRLGRAVAGITTAQFDTHGWITGGSGNQLAYERGVWSEVLAEAIQRDATEVEFPDRFEDIPNRVIDLIRASEDVFDDAPSTLVHQDVHPDNVFHNHQPGVIDWEATLIGDPGLCLCWGEEWIADRADVPASDRNSLRTAVREGYQEQAGELPRELDRRRPVYRVVTFMPKVKTFDLWAPDAQEPTEDLAEWVGQELDDRVAAAEDAVY